MIDVKECPYYLYNENCTRCGSYSEGNPPCTRKCKWLILLEKILRIMAIITLPLWKLKPIQRFLPNFDELIEKITNW